jgi:hypothetical protein
MTTSETSVTSLFDQAVQTCGEAMKAGVKIQEDMARWWSEALEQGGAMQAWQKRSRAILSEAIPAAQKNAEEWLRVIEQNYRRGMELLKKALESEQGGAPTDIRTRTQELWEHALGAFRDSAQAMAQANVKMMEQWAEIVRKNMNTEEA